MQEHDVSLHAPLNKLFRHNFRHLLIFWIPCMLLMVVMMVVWLVMDTRNVSTQEAAYANRVATRINESFVGVRTSASLLSFNREVQTLIREQQLNLTDKFINRLNNIQQQIVVSSVQYPVLTSVTLHLSDPGYFIFKDSAYMRKVVHTRREEQMILHLEEQQAQPGWYLLDGDCCYFQPIWLGTKYQGCVFMRMSSTNIAAALSNAILDDTRRALLLDENGRVVADSRGGAAGTTLAEVYPQYTESHPLILSAADTLFFREESDLPGCDILIAVSQERLGAHWTVTLGAVLTVAVVLLLLFVYLLYRAAQSLCQPYEAILALLNEPEVLSSDEYKKRYRSIDKLGMIFTLIHKQSYQYMALKGELSEKERILREAQNAMLQSQINPHFLFNTLDNIYWMAMGVLPEDNRVSSTIHMLSRLLRLGLQRGSPLTTVREEMEHAQLYLEIQKIRMDHPFTVHWDVDESLAECSMLCLSLQPLLENAISHGIKERTDGVLRVDVHSRDGRMYISVTDNGAGFTPEQLIRLNQRFLAPYDTLREHIGLANINARLKLIYGSEGELSVESIPNQKTTVCMIFPQSAAE